MPGDILLKLYNEWRWPLRFKSIRNWRERFSKQNVLGAPITDDKIKHFVRGKHKFPGRILKKLVWSHPRKQQKIALSKTAVRIGNTLLHARMNLAGIKPIVPVKRYLITLVNLPQSCKAAEKCIESAKLYEENANLNVFSAIDQFHAESFFVEHGLSWISRAKRNIRRAAMGCFASHFSLWLKCMKLDEPIIILEHDVIFVSKVSALKFRHIAMLSRSELWELLAVKPEGRENTENYYPFSYMRGAGAYAITPEGAHFLVEDARLGVAFAVDNFIRREIVDIVDYRPEPFHHISYFSSISTATTEYESALTVWDKYKSHKKHFVTHENNS